MRKPTFLIAAIGLLVMVVVTARHLSRDTTDLSQTLGVFDLAFAPVDKSSGAGPIIRPVNRAQGVCLLAVGEGHEFLEAAKASISRVSTTVDLGLTTQVVDDYDACPSGQTGFYVLLGPNPGDAALRDLLGKLGETPPPTTIGPFDGVLGLSVSLPGVRDRDFFFVDTLAGEVHGPNTRVIFLEEFLQSLLRAPDIPSDGIVSVLAESFEGEDYRTWFDYNPRGLCRTDVILMHLLLGDTPLSALLRYAQARETLIKDYSMLSAKADRSRDLLGPDTDPRCW